ncbi:hypothetical protein L1987_05915 [Smallanthus sonchifolius]|uniref:Uncharacterized protein n=1 Tax=Smallanthus sonchifolius TaxID=185202 RepID=A0ACB9JWW0_9ASTR|nr:hypothetical protein L1987_05915 [Smallanthus sonchifolius]
MRDAKASEVNYVSSNDLGQSSFGSSCMGPTCGIRSRVGGFGWVMDDDDDDCGWSYDADPFDPFANSFGFSIDVNEMSCVNRLISDYDDKHGPLTKLMELPVIHNTMPETMDEALKVVTDEVMTGKNGKEKVEKRGS